MTVSISSSLSTSKLLLLLLMLIVLNTVKPVPSNTEIWTKAEVSTENACRRVSDVRIGVVTVDDA